MYFFLLQKRLKRFKALAQSSISNEEKKGFEQFMSVDYMSSEHSVSEDNTDGDENSSSGDEDAPKRKVLCRRPLTWRSENLTNRFPRLDRKCKRTLSQRSESMTIKRRDAPPPPPSERKAPDDAPQFALILGR